MIKRQSSTHIANPFLEEQEKILFEPDTIMRPDIFDQLSTYIQNGGNIEKIAPVLMRHYRGIPNMINVIAKILTDVVHVDSEEIIKRQVRNAMFDFFKIDKMDELLLTKKKIPKELKIMFQNEFWIDTIITLSEKPDYSQSLFIAYCMNKICKLHPEKISSLPPFYISYSSFQNVMRDIFLQMKNNPDSKLLDRLVKIISTDDLTLTHAALIFNDLPQEALIKITQKLKESKRNLFDKIRLNMDSSCDTGLSNLIIGRAKLTRSDLQKISVLEDISPHLKSLIIQKISEVLKDGGDDERTIHAAIDCIIKITDQNISKDDLTYIYTTFENISSYRLNDYIYMVLRTVQFPYFSDILKDIAIKQLNNIEKPDGVGNSPQSQIICEFSYRYRTKIPEMTNSLIKAFKSLLSSGSGEFQVHEFFFIFSYLVKLGYSKAILKKYSDTITTNKDAHIHRSFVKSLIELRIPKKYQSPSVCQFVEAIAIIFNNPYILNLIVPESSANIPSFYKTNMNILRNFLRDIPEDINIPDESKMILDSVRTRLRDLTA